MQLWESIGGGLRAGRAGRGGCGSGLGGSLERATTLAHELGHHIQRTTETASEDGETTTAARETEAEGTAFAVCSYFGLDTSRFSFAYIARYAETPEALAESLERVQRAARRLIEAVEGAEPEME